MTRQKFKETFNKKKKTRNYNKIIYDTSKKCGCTYIDEEKTCAKSNIEPLELFEGKHNIIEMLTDQNSALYFF